MAKTFLKYFTFDLKQYTLNFSIKYALTICVWLILSQQSFCQINLAKIDWKKELNLDCKNVWPQISIAVDTSSPAPILLQCSRCALKNNDDNLALRYINTCRAKGFDNERAMLTVEIRCLVRLKHDSLAVKKMSILAQLIDIYPQFEIPEFRLLASRNIEISNLMYQSQPSLDVFTFIISAICFMGFLLSTITLVFKTKKNPPQLWLGLFILTFVFIMSSFVLFWSKYIFQFPYLNGWWQSAYFLIGPFLYFYIAALFDGKILWRKKFLHFIPAVFILVVAYWGNQYSFGKTTIDSKFVTVLLFGMPMKTLHLLVYGILIYRTTSGDWTIDTKVNKWKNTVFVFYSVFTLANAIYYGLTFVPGFNTAWDYTISAIMALGVLGIATMGFIESNYLKFEVINRPTTDTSCKDTAIDKSALLSIQSFDNQESKVEHTIIVNEKYQTSNLTTNASFSIKVKLEYLIENKQIFMNNELRLQDVADELKVNRHHLSQVINENYGIGFFDLINRYRINYAANLMTQSKSKFTISEIAYQSGFNNKVTFYKEFKKYFKFTPLEYMANKEKGQIFQN